MISLAAKPSALATRFGTFQRDEWGECFVQSMPPFGDNGATGSPTPLLFRHDDNDKVPTSKRHGDCRPVAMFNRGRSPGKADRGSQRRDDEARATAPATAYREAVEPAGRAGTRIWRWGACAAAPGRWRMGCQSPKTPSQSLARGLSVCRNGDGRAPRGGPKRWTETAFVDG